MQSTVEESVRKKMEELRVVCDREISIQQEKIEATMVSLRKSMESIKSRVQETVDNQVELAKRKSQLREAEDDFVKALAVKTRKEAKRMATMDSISDTKARVEELKAVVRDQRARKDEYAAIISQQSLDLATYDQKNDEVSQSRGEIEEAISWYNRVLGFRIECGHGVKFIFTNINLKNPNEEYSFTIRHANDTYTLLDCSPHLNDSKELIHELNRTNGLFKFVRMIRGKFQEAATPGCVPQSTSFHQDSATISVSAPVSLVSTNNSESESPSKENEPQGKPGEVNRYPKKVNRGRGGKAAILSPGSAASHRRSPRFKAKK